MADKQDKKATPSSSSGEEKKKSPKPTKKNPSSIGERSKIEVDALKAMLKAKRKSEK